VKENEDVFDATQLIRNEEELRALIGFPSEVVQHKQIDKLDHHCRDFIAKSPFLLLSTSNSFGQCDVSPRGDHPGFVHVINAKHLVIPERPGNKRMDSLRNIVANPHAGLLFLIPGLGETLRINGCAYVTKDESLLRGMAVRDRPPVVGIVIEVEECYMHCAKAFLRSQLWKPDAWLGQQELPSSSGIIADHVRLDGMNAAAIAARLEDSYRNRLY
jgi:uncharacterized protein